MMAALNPAHVAGLLRSTLAAEKSVFLQISSGSMAPLLKAGDQIEVCALPLSQLARGDILLLEAPAALFSHRFWAMLNDEQGSWLVTRGDRMLSFDPPWKSEQLLGKIIGWRRQGRYYHLLGPAGQQLNQQLTTLVQAELDFLARLYRRPEIASWPTSSGPAPNFNQFNRSRLVTFLVRQLFKARANWIIHRQLRHLLN